jgi:hypothetical protein
MMCFLGTSEETASVKATSVLVEYANANTRADAY